MDVYFIFSLVLMATLVACVLLARCATHLGWLDHPGDDVIVRCASHKSRAFGVHKQHAEAVPPVGGVAMFLGLLCAVWMGWPSGLNVALYVVLCAVLLGVGWLDDVRGLSARKRFAVQIVCVMVMVHGGVCLHSFGDLLGDGQVLLGRYAVGATLVAVAAMINAYNMLDGLDGLCGGQIALGCVGLAGYLLILDQAVVLQRHLLLLAAVVCAFLCCNGPLKWRHMPRIFMGDAGSTMWGFVLAWWMIQVSQQPHAWVKPAACLWLVALPLWDATRLILVRGWRRQPVMGSDRLHVHHILRDLGFSSRVVCCMLWTLSLACVWLGCFFVRHQVHEVLIFWSFIAAFVVYACVFSGLSIRCSRENQPSGGCI